VKILLLNQTFYPDHVSTAQHLADVATGLVAQGHEVTVVASQRAYDKPDQCFPKHEVWRGITIHRVGSTRFGKGAKWKRALDFASFIASCCFRLVRLPRPDVVVALTSPPLISFIGAWFAKLHGARFVYWVMDFNPDEAIAAGWLRADSVSGRLLDRMSRFSLRQANQIIALDRFMQERIRQKGIVAEKITVLPPWSHDEHVRFDAAGREAFRHRHGWMDKFVVMYSGNHSPVHPLDTLLEAAQQLGEQRDILFAFVGGGSEFKRVQALQAERKNLFCLPYQPLTELSASLSAADAHVVVMGNPFIGLVHPCKIYNILTVAAPVVYIGPEPSHVTELLAGLPAHPQISVRHGAAAELARQILALKARVTPTPQREVGAACARFSRPVLLPQFLSAVTGGSSELAGQ